MAAQGGPPVGSMIGEVIRDCAVRMPATARAAEVITVIVTHIDHLGAPASA